MRHYFLAPDMLQLRFRLSHALDFDAFQDLDPVISFGKNISIRMTQGSSSVAPSKTFWLLSMALMARVFVRAPEKGEEVPDRAAKRDAKDMEVDDNGDGTQGEESQEVQSQEPPWSTGSSAFSPAGARALLERPETKRAMSALSGLEQAVLGGSPAGGGESSSPFPSSAPQEVVEI